MKGREERRQRGPDRGRREGGGEGGAQLRRKSSARIVRLPVSGCRASVTSRNRTGVRVRDRRRCAQGPSGELSERGPLCLGGGLKGA